MVNLHNVSAKLFSSIGLRLGWWAAIAVLFTYINITQSMVHGKLSVPPVYDDVAYLLEGATWLNTWRDRGLDGLLATPIGKSPVMLIITFVGFLLFGFQVWAPYAINSLLIFGLLIGLDFFSRELPLYQRFLLPLTALTYPLVANLVMEFRPDIVCSLTMAFYVAVALQMPWKLAPKLSFNSWNYHIGLSGLLAFALLAKPSIFPITILITSVTLFCTIATDKLDKEIDSRRSTVSLSQVFKTTLTSLSLSFLLASPYYIFGGFKTIIDYIHIVIFGSNRGVWATNLPLTDNLTYYLTGRGGWMIGAWFWFDIMILTITLITIIFQKQWQFARRAIAAILIFICAYTSVTIPSTKSPFLGLMVTALLLVFSYLCMIYWLVFLNNWLKKSVSQFLSKLLGIILIFSLIFHQWRSFPFIGGGVHLLPATKVEKYNQALGQVVQFFRPIYPSISKSDRQTIFIPTSTSFLNPTNLNLLFQFDQIQTIEAKGVDLNQDNLDDIQTYKQKSQTSTYTLLVRSPSVTYPSPKKKGGNNEFGEELYHFLETSGEFKRIDRQTTSILQGELLIYRRTSHKNS